MTHHGDVLEIQMLNQFGKIVRVLIHVVAGPGLTRSAVPAPIMSNDSKALLAKE
jgi:hypothetical protein